MANNINVPPIAFGSASTIGMSVAATSSRVALPTAPSGNLRIYVQGANDVFFELGGSTVAATIPVNAGANGGFVVKAGTEKLIASKGQTNIAAIAAVAGPTQVYITPCEGNSL